MKKIKIQMQENVKSENTGKRALKYFDTAANII